jgi:hypothetical protein
MLCVTKQGEKTHDRGEIIDLGRQTGFDRKKDEGRAVRCVRSRRETERSDASSDAPPPFFSSLTFASADDAFDAQRGRHTLHRASVIQGLTGVVVLRSKTARGSNQLASVKQRR